MPGYAADTGLRTVCACVFANSTAKSESMRNFLDRKLVFSKIHSPKANSMCKKANNNGNLPSCFSHLPLTTNHYLCAMQILDGKKAAQAIKDQLKLDTAQLAVEGKKLPHLAAVLVGNNGASETYVAGKVKACGEVGFKSTLIRFEETVTE